MTALCVVLLAFLYLEPAHASEHAAPTHHGFEQVLVVGDGYLVHTHDFHHDHDQPAAPDQMPGQDGTEPHAHHFAGACPAFLPTDAGLLAGAQAALKVVFSRGTPPPAIGMIFGLDRPPRTGAVV